MVRDITPGRGVQVHSVAPPISTVCFSVAPYHPGAAILNRSNDPRGQNTSEITRYED
jgi:hypothetical protein